MEKGFEVTYKILLIGDSAVGKSSLLMRFTEDTFTPNFISTIGFSPGVKSFLLGSKTLISFLIDFKAKVVTVDGKRIKLQVWDTAGQERFRTITTAYFRSAVGILLVYDVTNAETFQNLNQWIKAIEMHATEDVTRVLVGNKSDMTDKRTVDKSRGQELARQFGIRFYETSAKTGDNVYDLFETLAKDISKNIERLKNPQPADASKSGTISADKMAAANKGETKEESKCCK